MKFAYTPFLMSSLLLVLVACSSGSTAEGEREIVTSGEGPNQEVAPGLQVPEEPMVEESMVGGTAAPATVPATDEPVSTPAPSPEEPVGASGPADREGVYSGVYTAAQANRGQQIQQVECSACHSPSDWAGGRVLLGYTGQSVNDFVEQLRATMPLDGPGRLTHQQYVDLVAFILQVNNVPAGREELPADPDALARIRLEYRR